MRIIIMAALLWASAANADSINFNGIKPMLSSDLPLTGAEEAALLNVLGGAMINATRTDATVPCFAPVAKKRFEPLPGSVRSNPNKCIVFAQPATSETYPSPTLTTNTTAHSTTTTPGKPGSVTKTTYDRMTVTATLPVPSIDQYMKAGIGLSDHFCAIYFRRVSHDARGRGFARSLVNDVGTLVTALIGLSGGSGPISSSVAAGFGFADSGFRNYDESFLVSPDLPNLRALVKSAQMQWQKDYLARPDTDKPTGFPQAIDLIRSYAELCSFVGMKSLVNESVTQKIALEPIKDQVAALKADTATANAATEKAAQTLQATVGKVLAELVDSQKAIKQTVGNLAGDVNKMRAALPAAPQPAAPSGDATTGTTPTNHR